MGVAGVNHHVFIFLSLFFISKAFAFNIPGEVPLFDLSQPEAREPATDLIYNNRVQSTDSLKALHASWLKQLGSISAGQILSASEKEKLRNSDISKLQPAPQRIQGNWVNQLFLVDDKIEFQEINGLSISRSDKIKSTFEKMDSIKVGNNDLVYFYGLTPYKDDDLYDFRVTTQSRGISSKFRIYLGEQAHNILLRKTLLRKLGFREPAFKYLSTVRVVFPGPEKAIEVLQGSLIGSIDRVEGRLGISTNTGADPRRWLKGNYRQKTITQKINQQTGELEDVEEEVWNFPDRLPTGEVIVTFQDVLVHPESEQARLALGNLSHENNGRRRIYNSLLLAYNLVNVPESLNSFSPIPFMVKAQKLILNHDPKYLNNFSPDIYDLKWMARRLASFSRKDFEHIAKEAHYPKEVELLVVELLIARRNYMQKFLLSREPDCYGALKYETPPYYCLGEETQKNYPRLSGQFKVNLKLNHGPKLVDGKLTIDTRGAQYNNSNKWWVGYGSRFSFHQEESPLVFSEIFSYFRSILQSSVLEALIDKNINNLLRLDSETKIAERLNELRQQNIQYLIEHGEAIREGNEDAVLQSVPIGFHTVPTASAQLILNRNIVIGSQQGVDNQIQLVDTFGYLVRAGFHSELEGFENLNLFSDYEGPHTGQIGLDANYTFLRRWTHLQPIRVIKAPGSEGLDGPLKKALKESYSQAIIPKLLKDFREEVDDISPLTENSSAQEKEAYKQVVQKNYDVLNKYLKVGESLIISNTMGPAVSGSYSHRFLDISARVFMNFLLKSEDLSRVHIFRKSKKEILIYKTKANQVAWSVGLGANYYIPVVSLRQQKTTGQAKTWFHKISNMEPTETIRGIDGQIETIINTDFQKNMTILLQTIAQDSLSDSNSFRDQNLLINKEIPPYVIGHKYKQREMNFKFLFFNHSNHTTSDQMSIYAPYSHVFPKFHQGHTTSYLRYSQGFREGVDYQSLIKDVINYVLEDKGIDGRVLLSSSGDPADTLFGKSKSLSIILDSRVTEPKPGVLVDTGRVFKDPFLKLHHVWKGGVDFGLSEKETIKLLKKVNGHLSFSEGYRLFDPEKFSRLERLQLYRVGVDLIIYKEGLEKLLSQSGHDFEVTFKRRRKKVTHQERSYDQNELIQDQEALAVRMEYEALLKAYRRGQPQKISKHLVNVVRLLQKYMNFEQFAHFFDEVPKFKNEIQKPLRNIYIKGVVNGFRLGDENLKPILSNEIGFPRKKSVNGITYDYTYGDLELIKNRIGINNNEFYLNWIMRSYL